MRLSHLIPQYLWCHKIKNSYLSVYASDMKKVGFEITRGVLMYICRFNTFHGDCPEKNNGNNKYIGCRYVAKNRLLYVVPVLYVTFFSVVKMYIVDCCPQRMLVDISTMVYSLVTYHHMIPHFMALCVPTTLYIHVLLQLYIIFSSTEYMFQLRLPLSGILSALSLKILKLCLL